MKKKILVVDPPGGWLFGFPKSVPVFKTEEEKEDWFRSEGYPDESIKVGMLRHCRYWETEVDVSSEEG